MFFITRCHHEDIIREKNLQIGYRDHRIAQLEAERKLLWDKRCLLEIGETIFNDASALRNRACPDRHPEPSEVCEVKDLNSTSFEAAQERNHDLSSCGTAALGGEPGAQRPTAANGYVRLGHPRPSQIMRRMDRIMHNRWLQKRRPAKSAEQKRDEVLNELSTAHREAVISSINPTR